MKKFMYLSIIVMCLAIILLAGNARAAWRIALYADSNFTVCETSDSVAILKVYAVLVDNQGSMGVSFKIHGPTGEAPPQWVSDNFGDNIHHGNTQDGVVILYPCTEGQKLLATITYIGRGGSFPCSYFEVKPAHIGMIGGIDCFFYQESVGQHYLYINPDGSCHCNAPVPSQASSWGRIKSLYR